MTFRFFKGIEKKKRTIFFKRFRAKRKKVKDKFLDKKKERNNLKIDKQGKRSFQQNED